MKVEIIVSKPKVGLIGDAQGRGNMDQRQRLESSVYCSCIDHPETVHWVVLPPPPRENTSYHSMWRVGHTASLPLIERKLGGSANIAAEL